jgi:dephospho-CoA kinase
VLSTDQVVHELYGEPEVRDAVVDRFGQGVAPDGVVDRSAVARLVFADPDQRAWLEGLLWPRVGERMVSWRQGLEDLTPSPRAAVVEVPLLFESGLERGYDATIAVIADEELRAARAGSRRHEALEERGKRQLSQQEKAQRATYVVVNDGSMDELEANLSSVLEMLAK